MTPREKGKLRRRRPAAVALPSKHLGLFRYPANASVKTFLFNFTFFVSLNVNFQNFIKKKTYAKLAAVAHASPQEAEAGGLPGVPGQTELRSESVSQKTRPLK